MIPLQGCFKGKIQVEYLEITATRKITAARHSLGKY